MTKKELINRLALAKDNTKLQIKSPSGIEWELDKFEIDVKENVLKIRVK